MIPSEILKRIEETLYQAILSFPLESGRALPESYGHLQEAHDEIRKIMKSAPVNERRPMNYMFKMADVPESIRNKANAALDECSKQYEEMWKKYDPYGRNKMSKCDRDFWLHGYISGLLEEQQPKEKVIKLNPGNFHAY